MKKVLLMIFTLVAVSISCVFAQQPSGDSLPSVEARGSVNRSEIGEGSLSIASMITEKNDLVQVDGTFKTLIPANKSIILLLVDDAFNVRAMTLSLPKHKDSIIFDAASTAQAMIYMPSFETDPVRAEMWWPLIREIPTFPKIVSFLKTKIPNCSPDLAANNLEFMALHKQCLVEWLEKLGASPERIQQIKDMPIILPKDLLGKDK